MHLAQKMGSCITNSQSKKGDAMKKSIFILSFILFVTSGLFAQSNKTPGINKQQNKQLHKINQGVKSGELTRVETHRLLTQEAKLQRHKRIAKSDGVVTPWERAKLHNETAKLNRNIYKQKHDRQKRR